MNTMRPTVSIVTYPTITEFANFTSIRNIYEEIEQLPLGPLIVAQLFREQHADVHFVDANREYYLFLEQGNTAADYCDYLSTKLAKQPSSLYGFSSICSSYHITLILAQQLKALKPACTIFLGGPQASATAGKTMEQCPYIDFVIGGEAERSIPEFIEYFNISPEKVPGLYWRNSKKEIVSNRYMPPDNLDRLPEPAYDLYHPLFQGRSTNIEAGRGCSYNCKFCSTNHFFGRSYRLKSTDKLISEATHLTAKYNVNFVKFNHDNMFCNTKRLRDFCHKWTSVESVRRIRWSCSLRADFITGEIIELLAACNCHAIFIGIESGSLRMQSILNKNINLEKATENIFRLHDHGILTTTSFIIGFPEETEEDLTSTLNLFYLMLTQKLSSPQIGSLSPVAGSTYYKEYLEYLTFDNSFSNMAHQGSVLPHEYMEMLNTSPELFSAHYSLPLHYLDRKHVHSLVKLLTYASALFRYLLLISAYCVEGLHTLSLLWSRYEKSGEDDPAYYSSYEFYQDFLLFTKTLPETDSFNNACIEQFQFLYDSYNLVDHEYHFLRERSIYAAEQVSMEDVLKLSCLIRDTSFSFKDIIDGFDSNIDIEKIPQKHSLIILFMEDDKIVVEEPSALTKLIVNCFRKQKKVADAVLDLFQNRQLLLSDKKYKPKEFVFAIQTLVNRGLLERVPSP